MSPSFRRKAAFVLLALLAAAVLAVVVHVKNSFPGPARSAAGFAMLRRLEAKYHAQVGIQMQRQFCRYYIPPEVDVSPIIDELYQSELLDFFPEIQIVAGGAIISVAVYEGAEENNERGGWRLDRAKAAGSNPPEPKQKPKPKTSDLDS